MYCYLLNKKLLFLSWEDLMEELCDNCMYVLFLMLL